MAQTPMTTLRRFVAGHRSQAAAARALKISPTYLSFLLNSKMAISAPMLARLGYTRRIVIERKGTK